VYAIGGHGTGLCVERYDPEADTWSRLHEAPAEFDRFGIATVGNEIYCVGGEVSPRRVWRFQPRPD